jgi:hypothetical protein
VGDPLFAAAAVEQHLGRVGAEAAGEDLAVVGEDFLGGAVAGQAWVKTRQTLWALARSTSPAMTQNREWSSRPVTALSSRPSVSQIPPMTSSCHSSIGRGRSQRRELALARRRGWGWMRPLRTRAR